jgi:SAM-dependent methyltransferase
MLDLFVVRRGILNALSDHLAFLKGTVLDVGCGHKPYKSLVLGYPSQAEKYIGLDVANDTYQEPDIKWDGKLIPLHSASVECALATEVFEHCPDPERIMGEVLRVLKPGGVLFFTVPFLWPLHDVPHDEYRYTPFALERHLENAGFAQVQLKALGGWDASLAQMIGLWTLRRPMSTRKRAIFSRLAVPFVRYLAKHDTLPTEFYEGSMITGISATAIKPA